MPRPSPRSTRRRTLFISLAILVLVAIGFLIYAVATGLFVSGPKEIAPAAQLSEPVSIPEEAPRAEAPAAIPEEAVIPPAETEVPVGYARGNRAPDFTLRSLDGEAVSLSDFRGHMVILDFWASWCTPCRVSMPTLHALWGHYRDQGVVLVGVSLDRTESDARSYLKANGFSGMVALWESMTASQAVAKMYGVVGIPRTLVIDADGVVRFAGHPATLTSTLIELYL